MNDLTQDIYRERIKCLLDNFDPDWQDAEYSMKKIDHELWGCFSDTAHVIGEQHKMGDLLMWLRFGKEKLNDAVNTLHMLQDELDDIEEEVRKHEINYSDGEGMLPLP